MGPTTVITLATPVAIDLNEAREALRTAAERVADLIRDIEDPNVRAFGLDWTVGETSAHIAIGAEEFAAYARGLREPEPGPRDMDAWNSRTLAETRVDNIGAIGQRLVAAVDSFLDATEGRSPDSPMPAFKGVIAGLDAVICAALGELIVHGVDIAKGIGAPWKIERSHARLVLAGTMAFLPLYINQAAAQTLTATFELRIRGGARYSISFRAGRLEISERRMDRVDCVISADPVAFLLVGYGRASLVTLAVQRKLFAWGRRPWLALRLPELLTQP